MEETLISLDTLAQVVIIILAFSALVFVHELGHYLACRLSGVTVERFFVGFDVWGLGFKVKVGECVYGIGALPLGGYCKPKGQSDDPTAMPDGKVEEGDLRSRSLGAQALVFAGGVFMNFVFGYLLLVTAYSIGIRLIPPIIGEVQPDGPADLAGLQSGDRVLTIRPQASDAQPERMESFMDIQEMNAFHPEEDLLYTIRRTVETPEEGEQEKTMEIRVRPIRDAQHRGNIARIFIAPVTSRRIRGVVQAPEYQELARKLRPDDIIAAVNGTPVTQYEGHMILDAIEHAERPWLDLTIERDTGDTTKTMQMRVPLVAQRGSVCTALGLGFSIRVIDVHKGSPAAKAELAVGDVIESLDVDGKIVHLKSTDDFVERVRSHAFQPVELTVVRAADGKEETISFNPKPLFGHPDVVPGKDTFLGVLASPAENDGGFLVTQVLSNGPAAGVLHKGDRLLHIRSATPVDGTFRAAKLDAAKPLGAQVDRISTTPVVMMVKKKNAKDAKPVLLQPRFDPNNGRPMIGIVLGYGQLTYIRPGSYADQQAGLKKALGDRFLTMTYSPDLSIIRMRMERTVAGPESMKEEVAQDYWLWFPTPKEVIENPRAAGIQLVAPFNIKEFREASPAPTFLVACKRAGRKWVDLALVVYRTLYQLSVGKQKITAVGGPVMLMTHIKAAREVGFGFLLLMVAMISINLGVINLLPFPVLDGGHLVFLLYEWVRGRPPSEKVREIAQYIGLVCLLTLILAVSSVDLWYAFK